MNLSSPTNSDTIVLTEFLVYYMSTINQENSYRKKVAYLQAVADLDAKTSSAKSTGKFLKAYLLSVFVPPIGIYYFVKYTVVGNGADYESKAGVIALLLTICSLVTTIWMTVALFSNTSTMLSPDSNLLLENLSAEENQKTMLDLLK